MNLLDIKIGLAKNFARMHDEQRLVRQRCRSLSSSKEARLARKMELTIQNEFYEETEGLSDEPRIAD